MDSDLFRWIFDKIGKYSCSRSSTALLISCMTFTQIQPQDHKPRPADAPDYDSDTKSQTYQDNDSTDDNDVPIDDDSSRDMIELCLPNYEIRSIFDRWLRIHMKNRISAQKQQ